MVSAVAAACCKHYLPEKPAIMKSTPAASRCLKAMDPSLAKMMSEQGGDAAQKQQEQEEKMKQMEERRQSILSSMLTPAARERLANIALVKADKARKIEDLLIMNAQRGVIQGKVDETQLKAMLEQINEKTEQKVKVTVARRMNWDDSDDD